MSLTSQVAGELARRHFKERVFEYLCLGALWSGVAILGLLILGTMVQAWGWLDWQFLTSWDSRKPAEAGLLAPLWGSFWIITLTGIFTIPVGVGAAIFLEEYASDTWLRRLIQVNLSNLAGVPSIVYGILGMTLFVRFFGIFGSHPKQLLVNLGFTVWSVPLPFGRCVISGALTLALLVFPTVVVAAQEALRGIPPSIRHASLALGATKWQTIRHQVVPAALPGILTGIILAMSRAMGEAAPLILVGALTYVAFAPGRISSFDDILHNPGALLSAPFDTFTALPIQVFSWIGRPKAGFQYVSAAGIVVLLIVLIGMNSLAIYARQRFRQKMKW